MKVDNRDNVVKFRTKQMNGQKKLHWQNNKIPLFIALTANAHEYCTPLHDMLLVSERMYFCVCVCVSAFQ